MDSIGVGLSADYLGTLGDILVDPSSLLSRMVVYTLVGSVLGFQCYNSALNFVPAPEKYASEKRFKWRNVMTSFVHALITGSISIYCNTSRPELFTDMLNNTNHIAEALTAFSCGYFIYDTADLLMTGTLRNQWALIIHHVIIMTVFLLFLHYTFAMPCCVLALLVEVNSIFLHGRQLYIMSGFDKSTPFFKAFTAANIASFVFMRFGVIVFFFNFMYVQREVLPPTVMWTMLPVMVVMAVINAVLFWRLLKSDLFATNKDKQPEILLSN